MSVRTAYDYFKRAAMPAPSPSPIGGGVPSVVGAADVQTAYQQTNAYLDQWLGAQPASSPSLPAAPAPAPEPKRAEAPQGQGPLLRRGTGGGTVKQLQERLAELGFDPGPLDGAFGPKTMAAVRRFQQDRGIRVDGIVGPETWGQLGIRVEGRPSATAPAEAPGQGGVVNTPDGQMVRRMGKLISVRVADKFDKMVAAAKADGVNLTITSAYRSYAEQVELWNRFGRNPARVARPGTSNHQKGEAIDFGREGWAWLKANASKFGFHNYPPEPWHYSLDGH